CDADTTNVAEVAATGAVKVFVGAPAVEVPDAVASYTYSSSTHTVQVNQMTLDAKTGPLVFEVEVTAPSGSKLKISTSATLHTVYAVPNAVAVALISGSAQYKLVDATETGTRFVFSNTNPAIDALSMAPFAAGSTVSAAVALTATTATSVVLGATFTATRSLGATITAPVTNGSASFTFTFAATRTKATASVAASEMYTFPSLASTIVSVTSTGPLGGSTVTINKQASLVWSFGTASVPVGATHAVASGGATYTATTATPVATSATSLTYAMTPTAKQAIAPTLSVTFGGVTRTYTVTALTASQVIEMPTAVASTISFTGTQVGADDASIGTLALGASYGPNAQLAGTVVCGDGNTSSIVLQLTGPVGLTGLAVSSVSAVDSVATGAAYGTVASYTFDPTANTVSIGRYTLDSSAPSSGSVRFSVVVRAPDGYTVPLSTSPIAVAAVGTVTLGEIVSGLT
ncbi:MAG: hypothetical protein EBZ77_15545, partial [Chitinophagia bacterium]|nr:hypothetical protein [Chitinophagia bacterium]